MSLYEVANGGQAVSLLLLLLLLARLLPTLTVGGAIIASDVRRTSLAASSFSGQFLVVFDKDFAYGEFDFRSTAD